MPLGGLGLGAIFEAPQAHPVEAAPGVEAGVGRPAGPGGEHGAQLRRLPLVVESRHLQAVLRGLDRAGGGLDGERRAHDSRAARHRQADLGVAAGQRQGVEIARQPDPDQHPAAVDVRPAGARRRLRGLGGRRPRAGLLSAGQRRLGDGEGLRRLGYGLGGLGGSGGGNGRRHLRRPGSGAPRRRRAGETRRQESESAGDRRRPPPALHPRASPCSETTREVKAARTKTLIRLLTSHCTSARAA